MPKLRRQQPAQPALPLIRQLPKKGYSVAEAAQIMVLRLTLSERFLPNLSESRPGSVPLQARPA